MLYYNDIHGQQNDKIYLINTPMSLKAIADSSFKIYNKHRNKGDVLSELLFYIAAYFSKNIYVK